MLFAYALALVSTTQSSPTAPDPQPPLVNGGKLEIDGRKWGIDSGRPGAVADDKGTWRFEVDDGDHRGGDVAGAERSEIRTLTEFPHGTAVIASFDLKIQSVSPNHAFQLFAQFHTKPAQGWSPWLALYYASPSSLRLRWASSAVCSDGSLCSKPQGGQTIPLRADGWLRVCIAVQTGAEDGQLKAWVDGEQKVDYKGPLGYFATRHGAGRMGFFKLGIYRWRQKGSAPTVVYVRNIKLQSVEGDTQPACSALTG